MEWSLTKYEEFIYSIANEFSFVERSNLIVKRRGKDWAELTGRVYFENDYSLEVREIVDFSSENFIRRYGYAVRKGDEILYWYDSQEHPDDPNLQITHPHNKHIHPNIKHNRIPAPLMSFSRPNLLVIIQEIEDLIKGLEKMK
jgi:hypothetical protein